MIQHRLKSKGCRQQGVDLCLNKKRWRSEAMVKKVITNPPLKKGGNGLAVKVPPLTRGRLGGGGLVVTY
jgi:hypothetical protein